MSEQFKYTQDNLINNKHIYDTTYDIASAITILSAVFEENHPEHKRDYYDIKLEVKHLSKWNEIKQDLESLIDDVIEFNRQ
jgi:hypothetical protein